MPPKDQASIMRKLKAQAKNAAKGPDATEVKKSRKTYAPTQASVKKSTILPDLQIRRIFQEALDEQQEDMAFFIQRQLELLRKKPAKGFFPGPHIATILRALNVLPDSEDLTKFVKEALATNKQSIKEFWDNDYSKRSEITLKIRAFEDPELLEAETYFEDMSVEKSVKDSLKKTMDQVKKMTGEEITFDLDEEEIDDIGREFGVAEPIHDNLVVNQHVIIPDPDGKSGSTIRAIITSIDPIASTYLVRTKSKVPIEMEVAFDVVHEDTFFPPPKKEVAPVVVIDMPPGEVPGMEGLVSGPRKSIISNSPYGVEKTTQISPTRKQLNVKINKSKIDEFKKSSWLHDSLKEIYISPIYSNPATFQTVEFFIDKEAPAITDPFAFAEADDDDEMIEIIEDYEEAMSRFKSGEVIYFQTNLKFYYLLFNISQSSQTDYVFQSKDDLGNILNMFVIYALNDGTYIQQDENIFQLQKSTNKESIKNKTNFITDYSKHDIEDVLIDICEHLVSSSLYKIAPEIDDYKKDSPFIKDLIKEFVKNSRTTTTPTITFITYVAELIFYITLDECKIFQARLQSGFYLPQILASLPISEKLVLNSADSTIFGPCPELISDERTLRSINLGVKQQIQSIWEFYQSVKFPTSSKKTKSFIPRYSTFSTKKIKNLCVNSGSPEIRDVPDHELILFWDEEESQWYCLRIQEDIISQLESPSLPSGEKIWKIVIKPYHSDVLNIIAQETDIEIDDSTQVPDLLEQAADALSIKKLGKSYSQLFLEIAEMLGLEDYADDPPIIEYEDSLGFDETQSTKPIKNPYSGSLIPQEFIDKFSEKFLERMQKQNLPNPIIEEVEEDELNTTTLAIQSDEDKLIDSLLFSTKDLFTLDEPVLAPTPIVAPPLGPDDDESKASSFSDDDMSVDSVSTTKTVEEIISRPVSIGQCRQCGKSIDQNSGACIQTIEATKDGYITVQLCDSKCLENCKALDDDMAEKFQRMGPKDKK